MSLNCKSCGGMRNHSPNFSNKCGKSNTINKPSPTSNRRGETKSSNSSSSLSSSKFAPPKVVIDNIDLSKVGGWYIPTYSEIAKGMNPHFKSVNGDTNACIMAKNMFNQAINNSFNVGNTTYGIGLVAEVVRIKKEMATSIQSMQKVCVTTRDSNGNKLSGSPQLDIHGRGGGRR